MRAVLLLLSVLFGVMGCIGAANAAGDSARGSVLYHSTYACTDCHESNPTAASAVSAGATVEGLKTAIQAVGPMRTRFASTLGQNDTDLADVSAYLASVTSSVAAAANYEGLWWNAPAGSESGWGINLAHQGDVIFASWFTYDLTGKGWWLVMTANKTAANSYSGTLYQTTGPAFSAAHFDPSGVSATSVGTGTLTFVDSNNGSFAYSVNGIAQTKSITRESFGPMPTCTFASQTSHAAATNYQDLWWAAPAASESGWGVNFTHQGDAIFATWFTYDVDHTPMWLVVTAQKSSAGVYTGTLYRTTGPAFNAVPFNPNNIVATSVGTATITFTDGNTATFATTVNGVAQAKAITREVFVAPGTTCQ